MHSYRRTPNRAHLAIQISNGLPCLLHQEEGWSSPVGARLPGPECHDREELIPDPLISELINQLRGAKYFTKLDVWWGYNNVHISEGDEWKAAFQTNIEPLVMFFGLTNSPATFQTTRNDIFPDLIMEGVVCVYLDDILIFTKSLAEQWRVVQQVMEWLQQYKLYLRPEKCEFEQMKIEYLGLIV